MFAQGFRAYHVEQCDVVLLGDEWKRNSLRPLYIRLLVLMRHVNLELLIDIQEMTGYLLERLVVLLKRLEEHRFGLEDLLRDNSVRHPLYYPTPRGSVRPIVWRAQKDNTVRRHVDGAEVFLVGVSQIIRIQERPLGDDAPEAVDDPYDGIPFTPFALTVVSESRDEGLRVVVDEIVTRVFGRPFPESSVHIGVVPVYQHVGMLIFQRSR